MQISELQTALDDARPDDHETTDALRIIMANVGVMAKGETDLEDLDHQLTKATKDEQRREMLGSLVTAAADYANENGIDMEQAAEEYLEDARELYETGAANELTV